MAPERYGVRREASIGPRSRSPPQGGAPGAPRPVDAGGCFAKLTPRKRFATLPGLSESAEEVPVTSTPAPSTLRLLPAVLLAGVWIVFMALGLGTLLIPPLAALAVIYLLFPWRSQAWARRTMAAVGVLALLWLLNKVQSIVWIACLGLFTAYVLNPPVTWLEKRGVRRATAALLMLLPALGFAALAGWIVLPRLYAQAVELLAQIPQTVSGLIDRYGSTFQAGRFENLPFDPGTIVNRLSAAAEKVIGGAGSGLLQVGKQVGVFLSVVVITPVVGFHLLKDFPALKEGSRQLLPRRFEGEVTGLFAEMDELIGGYLRGQIIVALIIGTLTAVGLTLFSLPYSVLLGAITGILNLVPVVGFWTSVLLALLAALSSHHIGTAALGVGVTFGFCQLLEQNLLSPRIVGKHTGLHPVAILLGLLVFGALGGLAGAILAIPITLFLRLLYRRYMAGMVRGAGSPPVAPEPAPPGPAPER
jgi:predicted PurR-regulated permease PerM